VRNPREHRMSLVPQVMAERSVFDLSSTHKTTFNSGYLIPVWYEEILPGDTMNMNLQFFCRLSNALQMPLMDNIYLDLQAWYVPYRLLWENWQHFCGEKDDPDDDPTDYLVPQIETPAVTGCTVGELGDYLGIPIGIPDLHVNAWRFRAYNLIWNTFYRHQKVHYSEPFTNGDSGDSWTDYHLLRRTKQANDYFASCLPEPQEDAGVSIPLGTSAPVFGTGTALGLYGRAAGGTTPTLFGMGSQTVNGLHADTGAYGDTAGSGYVAGNEPLDSESIGVPTKSQMTTLGGSTWANTGLYTDLSAATSATINSLRLAFAMQRYKEALMRCGNKYIEQLRMIWQVEPGDYRLQRPEFLGSSVNMLHTHVVPQTAPGGGGSTALGDVAAFSTGSGGLRLVHSFVEHGEVIILASVRADITHQFGLDQSYSRQTMYDFYLPPFAHLGEQAILTREIFCNGTASDTTVFGYHEYGARHRFKPSQITGMFRSNYASSLDVWHLAQDWGATAPTLSAPFLSENPPISRILKVTPAAGVPEIIYDQAAWVRMARRMPTYAVPGELDHH
jgi:hypothetical protein